MAEGVSGRLSRMVQMNKKIMIASLAASVALVGIILCPRRPPSQDLFDPLIDNSLIEGSCRNIVPFSINLSHAKNKLEYFVDFDLNTDDARIYSRATIRIQRAGLFKPRGGWGIGPGGGGDKYVVRTYDRRYDIIVQQSNRLKTGVISPGILTRELALELAGRYRKSRRPDL